jgi:hypothetical protein
LSADIHAAVAGRATHGGICRCENHACTGGSLDRGDLRRGLTSQRRIDLLEQRHARRTEHSQGFALALRGGDCIQPAAVGVEGDDIGNDGPGLRWSG